MSRVISPLISSYLMVDQQEAGYITSRLIENRGNISLTAQELGVSRVTLYGKLKKYGISAATRDGEDSPDAAA